MLKKFLLASAVIVSASTAALAADMAPAAYDWTGFYIGLNAGAAWNNSEIDVSGTGPIASVIDDTINGDQTEFTGGAQMGYNWQMDSIVLGLETDFNFANFHTDKSVDLGGVDSAKFEAAANWYGTTTAKLGFAADNFLFYGDGGLAYGHSSGDAKLTIGGTTFEDDQSNVNWGWTLGAGMKYGMSPNWVLGAEYKYVNLGEADFEANTGLGDEVRNNTTTAFSVVRATLDYRF